MAALKALFVPRPKGGGVGEGVEWGGGTEVRMGGE